MAMLFAAVALLAAAPEIAWTGFRGDGTNVALAAEIPLAWNDNQGIAWQTQLAGYGQSSPVVYGGRVFVTSVDGKSKERGLIVCCDLKTGAKLWSAEVTATQQIADGDMVSRGAPTPCVDAERLYVFFESGDLAAFDHAGKQLWHRSLAKEYGPYQGNHGLGCSLAQSADKLYLLVDHDGPSYLLAVDKRNGANRWMTERPSKISWSSPVYVDGSKPQVVASSNGSVEAYAAGDGKRLWTLPGIEGNTVASPTVTQNLVIIGSSDPGQTTALRRDKIRDGVPETAWRLKSLTASFSSPLVHQGRVYLVNKSGVAACVNATNGETLWTERLPGSCWATAIGTADRIYFFGKDGVTTVVAAGLKFERLAENRLTIEGRVYGAAAVRGALILRTGEKLICVGHP